ncbi:WASH complex subunit 3-like [Mytilus galloprovincialis]|uniref:WASH complex subunit 3-like n=1 Tax=Mytilus galloprovincialis TaxID=29158 RepID=UPI003F7CB705
MDSDGLPLVGPGVDYTKVEAIQQKRIVAFINHFVTHTAKFLNRFSSVCEEKLEHMSNRIQELEVSMNLLEAKLSSVPGLENVTAPASASNGTTSSQASGGPPPPVDTPVATPAATATPAGQPPPPDEAAPAPPPPESTNPVSKDPRYMKFFKMLHFGVPPTAIKLKMRDEGLDPELLDTPDAPAPVGGAPSEDSNSESDQEDNDDDEEDEEDW